MSEHHPTHTKPHDVGGQSGQELDTSERDISFWEQRIDAMVNLLRQKGIISDWAQLRVGVEALDPEDYQSLDYYERWALSASRIAVANRLVTAEELEERVNKLMKSS